MSPTPNNLLAMNDPARLHGLQQLSSVEDSECDGFNFRNGVGPTPLGSGAVENHNQYPLTLLLDTSSPPEQEAAVLPAAASSNRVLPSNSAWTPAAWEAAAHEAPQLVLPSNPTTTPSTPPATPAMSSYTFGSTYDEEDEDGDDDDSYHDLDAVMALVASSEFSGSEESNSVRGRAQRFDATTAIAPTLNLSLPRLQPRDFHTASVPTENDDYQDTHDQDRVAPLPQNFASTADIPILAAEEATVLETTTSLYAARSQQQSEDARLATNLREEDDLLLAMKLSAYEGGGDVSNYRRRLRNGTMSSHADDDVEHQEATVVAIADDYHFHRRDEYSSSASHASAVGATTVHAEWIGQDFSAPIRSSSEGSAASSSVGQYQHRLQPSSAMEHSTSSGSGAPTAAASATAVVDDDDTQEATVIDSAPLEKQDDEEVTFTEEAQVLVDNAPSSNNMDDDFNANENDSHRDADMDRKPAARTSRHGSSSSSRSSRGRVEAEVLAIQERRDIHPAEHTFERAFQAELVGTDYSYTVAVPSSSQTSSAVADRAAVLSSTRRRNSHEHHVSTAVHSTTTTATAATSPPEAMAFVATPADDSTPISTVASAVRETEMELAADFLGDEGEQIEEAHVFVSDDDSESLYLDQKPAAINHSSGSGGRRHPRNISRNTLPVIAEQEADLTSEGTYAQLPLPLDAASPLDTMSSSIQFDSEPAIAFVSENDEMTQHSHEPITLEAVHIATAADEVNSNPFSERRVSDRNDFNEGFLVESADDFRPADIVAIEEEEDIHPADLTGFGLRETSAELVGSVSSIGAFDAEAPQTISASAVIALALTSEEDEGNQCAVATAASEVVRGEPASPPTATVASAFLDPEPSTTTVATAFLDPQQALEVEESQDDGGLASLKTPASQRPTPFSDEPTDLPETSNSAHCGINVFQSDFEIFNGTTPETQPFEASARESSSTTVDSESNHTTTSQRSGLQSAASVNIQLLSSSVTRGTSAVIDALFGGSPPPFVPKRSRSADDDNFAVRAVSTRVLLPWSVINQKSSGMWIATLQTNQRALDKNDVVEASKSLRAFSMPSENQALSLARTWTPPRMQPFASHKNCHICKAKFAILRRACHCRNCGVCVCKDCVVPWPARMIPETYNIKKEHFVNACLSCNWLSNSFRLALLEGNRDQAVALHSTGNLNLHSPFANVKGELFYPVHCAVLGGSLELLRFLVDDNNCPIKSVRIAGGGKDANKYTPIVTSKGRSLLGIALENENLMILRYLVAEKGIMLSGERDVTQDLLCRNLEKLLRCVSEETMLGPLTVAAENSMSQALIRSMTSDGSNPSAGSSTFGGGYSSDNAPSALNDEAREFGAITLRELYQRGIDGGGEVDLAIEDAIANEECIICFDRSIDCVATPCGHQICCLVCSENLESRCPVCSSICSFMRVYKT